MIPKAFAVGSALAGTLLLAATIRSAPPHTISVGGFLSDAAGTPLEGVYTFRVDFYGPTGDTGIGTADTSATLTAGAFNLPVPVSEKVLNEPELRYRIWADVDRNGLTESDRFPDVFKLTAVPRAYRAMEQATLLKAKATQPGTGIRLTREEVQEPITTSLTAAEVPVNGLRFNTMSVNVNYSAMLEYHRYPGLAESHYDFGVYNAAGDLVVRSPLFQIGTKGHSGLLQVVTPTIELPAGPAYLAASSNLVEYIEGAGFGTTVDMGSATSAVDSYYIKSSISPAAPDGVLPEHISDIAHSASLVGPAIDFQYLPEAENLPPGAYRRSDQETPYQWILPTTKSFF